MTKEERMAIVAEIERLVDSGENPERLKKLRLIYEGKMTIPENFFKREEKQVAEITPIDKAKKLLEADGEISVAEVARRTGAKSKTLHNYIYQGRIKRPEQAEKSTEETPAEDQTEVLKLKEEIEHLEQTVKENEKDLDESQNVILGLEGEVKHLKSENQKLMSEVNDARNDAADARVEIKNTKNATEKVFEQNERLREKDIKWQAIVIERDKEIEALRNEVAALNMTAMNGQAEKVKLNALLQYVAADVEVQG